MKNPKRLKSAAESKAAAESITTDPPPIGLAYVPFIGPMVMPVTQVVRVVTGLYLAETLPHAIPSPQTGDLRTQVQARARINTSAQPQDDKRVLKVRDAMKCVDDILNGPELTTALLDATREVLIQTLVGGLLPASVFQRLANVLADCFREKALQQNNPRVLRFGPHYTRQG